MENLRLKPFDIVNDIYLLQEKKKFLFISYWKTIGVGSKQKCESAIKDLEKKGLLKLVDGMIEDTNNLLKSSK